MNDPNSFKKFGTETAVEIVKQLITLSSGFIVVTVTVVAAVIKAEELEVIAIAIFSWIFSIVSISSGILALGDIVTTTQDKNKFDVDEKYTRLFMQIQQVFFIFSFIFFIIFSCFNLIDYSVF